MGQHVRAALGPAGRVALVELIEQGQTFRQAAACLNVSPATAHRWWRRFSSALPAELACGSWALDRSSRPLCSPNQTPPDQERRICQARQRTNLGPGRLAGLVGCPRSTVWAVLARHGLSRRRRGERQTFKRYEWSQPGALLHMDVKRLARFEAPGHWVTGGQRAEQLRNRGAGYVWLHVIIDDHSRYLYVEQHDREDADINADTLHPRDLALHRAGGQPTPGGDDRQRACLHPLSALPGAAGPHRRSAHHPAALHAPLERQSRARHPHPPRRVGLRPLLAQLSTALPSPEIIRPLLQPQAATQQPRRPAPISRVQNLPRQDI